MIGMMRVKNEARWIGRVIESQLPVVDRLFIIDDHSTDGTDSICASYGAVKLIRSPFDTLDETRDKNLLLSEIEKSYPQGTWILAIDGDEEIAHGGCEEILKIQGIAGPDAYRFKVRYLWNSPDQVRVDGVYANFMRASMFRLKHGARFGSINGGGFHCGNTAGAAHIADCGVELLHYGYMEREDRIRKYEWYNAPDKQPIPPAEDGYRHMVIGDLLPASTVTKWAGPLTLRTL